MNYPVWFIPEIGGGLLIAAIAIVHVFISHFAVGGGLYLVIAERKGLREKSRAILDFTRSHAKFFLLTSVVAGGVTGVAIWWIISLVQPAATSLLIHTFVFGWATEWVFFIVEIVAIFIYFYMFGRMDDRTHQIVGWIYFAAAWLSLFVINGIIGFMLSPGAWPEDRSFWSGFFNPLFWQALAFRTAISCMFAGVYAFLTTSFLADEGTRRSMTLFSGKWVLFSLLGAVPSGIWYYHGVPVQARALIAGASPTIQRALAAGLWAVAILAVLTLLLVLMKPSRHTRPVSIFIFLSAFVFMGAFEWTREAARRPYVINQVMYSNGILRSDAPGLARSGYLASARWTRVKAVDEGKPKEAGRELFIHQCHACHTIGGGNNDIVARTRTMSYPAMVSYIMTLHEKRYFMPPFAGSEAEGKALAAFIVSGLQGKEIAEASAEGGTGKALFDSGCAACHDEDRIRQLTAGWERARIRRGLDGLSALNPEMPDYRGPAEEKELLADFIVSLHAPRGPAAPPVHPGRDVFERNCSVCHTLAGGTNPLPPKVAAWDRARIRSALDRLETLRGGVMPPLKASPEEKESLADFLLSTQQRRAK